jgi:prophage regulatory protein
MGTITIQQAKALADKWQAQHDDRDREPRASYFSDASAHDLIQMWETKRRVEGKKLNQWEFACLVEAWCETFGGLPHTTTDRSVPTDREQPEPLPADDTMLRMSDVTRLTGISQSTIKRMVEDARFPKPLKLGQRARGWLARDVRAFIEQLEDQRRSPRQ